MQIRIVILNYNGRDLLEACLPSVVDAARHAGDACAVTVLDNQSVDSSQDWVRKHYPEVDYVKAPSNRVFCSYNGYLRGIAEPFVILLNNDIRVERDFVDPLIRPLKEKADVFFTASRALGVPSNRYEGSLSKLELRKGLLWGSATFKGYESKIAEEHLTMQCGFGAFRKSYFLELGGYDDLYLPGTAEDSDLCFRAYRRGWKGYYCPKSVVYHIGQVSFKKAFGESGLRRMNRRNLYLFVWKNIHDPVLLIQHVLWIPVHFVKNILCGQFDFVGGLRDALCLLPKALAKRKASSKEPRCLSDRDIFNISKRI